MSMREKGIHPQNQEVIVPEFSRDMINFTTATGAPQISEVIDTILKSDRIYEKNNI